MTNRLETAASLMEKSRFNHWLSISLAVISAAVIALQLVLIRALSLIHYYHFTYFVISIALLGFGTSGTFLCFTYKRIERNFFKSVLKLTFLFLVSIPTCYWLITVIPLDIQYLLYSRGQLGYLVIYILLIFTPFFLGGLIIGATLTYFKHHIAKLYAANLLGSGLGGLAALGLMTLISPYRLPFAIACLVLVSLLAFRLAATVTTDSKQGVFSKLAIPAAILVTVAPLIYPLTIRVNEYKALSHFQTLEQQHNATHLITRFSPRAQIDVYSSPMFHYTLFAGPQTPIAPPEQLAVLIDGELAGTIFKIQQSDDAEILRYTPQSLPFRMMERPRVLLLGEVSGINVWLAKLFNAAEITVVQQDAALIRLIKEDLKSQTGSVYQLEQVKIENSTPRLFLEQTRETFDLIVFAASEGLASGAGGLQGLHEDYLLTVEGVQRALSRLSPNGLLSITRGIQSPPRDNIRILALAEKALSVDGKSPYLHILIGRNYLAATTLVSKQSLQPGQIDMFRSSAEDLQLDIEYYPDVSSADLQQFNIIEGPQDRNYSWIHYAAKTILVEDQAKTFFQNWIYDVRPPLDDRPYFYDFFKFSSIKRFYEIYDLHWVQQLELGFVVVLLTFALLVVAALLLIIAPMLFRSTQIGSSKNKLPTLVHFLTIGFGFMFVEITFIHRFIKFLGDPIYSAAAVLTSMLVFAGLGSISQQRLQLSAARRIQLASTAVVVLIALYWLSLESLLGYFLHLSDSFRFVVTILSLLPISFFLGWLFPSAVSLLEKQDPFLVPWAWGINGVASVAAAPLTIILAICFGFSTVLVLAACCYIAAGLVSVCWKCS